MSTLAEESSDRLSSSAAAPPSAAQPAAPSPLAVSPALASGLVAGRYRLLDALGAGATGSVYRARDEVLGRHVAMKVFRAESVLADDIVRQEREIRMLSMLTHPALVSVYDAGRQNFDGSIRRFVVMELVPDAPLERRMEAGALQHLEVVEIGAQIADALAYVHSKGVIHRDVKPANILISDTASSGFRRTVKLGDFGIAHFLEANRLTSDGTVIGTAGYLSPEQVAGGSVAAPSDVYSLGLVLLEALTGRQEFQGTAIEAAVARVGRDPVIPEELGEQWQHLLAAMTARDPADRPTALEVAAMLHGRPEQGLTGSGRRSTRMPRAHRRSAFGTVRQRRRRNALIGVGSALAVVLACGASFWLGYLVRG